MICPYCGSSVDIKDSAIIYRQSFGMVWVCSKFPDCDAYVGCKPGTEIPLGTLADMDLREARKKAHSAFDRLWKLKMAKEKCKKGVARTAGYRWLSKTLGIDPKKCHIAMMSLEQCREVCQLCKR